LTKERRVVRGGGGVGGGGGRRTNISHFNFSSLHLFFDIYDTYLE
jgi:hypothetical protein